ncbi:CCT3 [Branchiostoma lanceolatum]|uniref:T-complex protein 1 subunit gamma n=1 Tax=Branchiostoma lanceolatum TaxID=7740 RepID=A0A8J9ZK23_BRALA|nr:CCT3 [Branchiostoma lanceolatum]
MMGQGGPVLVLKQNTKRESGRKVQLGNVKAAKMISDVIRTCLGPRSMMKMLMDPMGGIVMTNDGNAILREIQVQHPAAKSMIEISRTQDEEVGDGTTSVIILAGEMLSVAEPFLEQQMHPTQIISAYRQALEDSLEVLRDQISVPVDVSNEDEMVKIICSALGTKFIRKWMALACKMALQSVKTVALDDQGRREIDIKRYAKVEKIPGGAIEDSQVLSGIMINKDVTHPKMRRRIENPRIVLLDCSLEYKKGESQTDIELVSEQDFSRMLQLEEEYIQKICEDIIRVKPDIVFTEKGVSDLAQHYLVKNNITAIRRIRKTDNNRIARACGANILNRTDELREDDVGTGAGLFEIKKFGDEYFTFITECKDPKILNEKAKSIQGVQQKPYMAVAKALEVVPITLIQNCGGNTIRTLTQLRAKHATAGNKSWGINGETGNIQDMEELGIWEPYAVKAQVYKTAVETAILLLRIDDIVSGSKKQAGADPMKPE